MASNINPINLGVNSNYFKKENNEDLTKGTKNESQSTDANKNQLNSNDVLSFLAAQNADVVPVKAQKTLDVSKYVTSEQEARIADFMKGFEADYDAALNLTKEEFPDLSDGAASSIALNFLDETY